MRVRLTVNGTSIDSDVEPRTTLADLLRDDLNLTGTNLACEQGVCGSCTVLFDGAAVRSCMLLAVQCEDRHVTTIEGLAPEASTPATLHPVQRAFHEAHALQCGFCTPGFVILVTAALRDDPSVVDDEHRLLALLSSNLCRCTGYVNIVEAVRRASTYLREAQHDGPAESPSA